MCSPQHFDYTHWAAPPTLMLCALPFQGAALKSRVSIISASKRRATAKGAPREVTTSALAPLACTLVSVALPTRAERRGDQWPKRNLTY